MDPVGRDPFVTKILKPAFLSHKKQIGHMICENAIELFRHRPIEGAQPRFHVDDQRPRTSGVEGNLGCNQGAGEGRIHIPDHHHDVRLLP